MTPSGACGTGLAKKTHRYWFYIQDGIPSRTTWGYPLSARVVRRRQGGGDAGAQMTQVRCAKTCDRNRSDSRRSGDPNPFGREAVSRSWVLDQARKMSTAALANSESIRSRAVTTPYDARLQRRSDAPELYARRIARQHLDEHTARGPLLGPIGKIRQC